MISGATTQSCSKVSPGHVQEATISSEAIAHRYVSRTGMFLYVLRQGDPCAETSPQELILFAIACCNA